MHKECWWGSLLENAHLEDEGDGMIEMNHRRQNASNPVLGSCPDFGTSSSTTTMLLNILFSHNPQ
jgi:hypothetical protein